MDPASLPSVDAPFLSKNEEFGITCAITGKGTKPKATTEARRVAVAFGEGDVQQGYTMLITMGVALVNLLWSKDFWRERARDGLIWPARAFSFSERQIWLSVKRALSLFSSPQANLVNFQQLKQLLMKYGLVNGNGDDTNFRRRIGVDVAVIMNVAIYAALVRDRELRYENGESLFNWSDLFIPFC